MGDIIQFPVKNEKLIDNNLIELKIAYNDLLNNFEMFFKDFVDIVKEIKEDEFSDEEQKQIIYIDHCVGGLIASSFGFKHPYKSEGINNLKE